MLTDETTTKNIALDHKAMPFPQEQIPALEGPMRQQFASAKINAAGMRTINGHDFLEFAIEVQLADGANHNHMVITSLDGRLLIISYNCMPARDATCPSLGARLIDSIRVENKPAG